MMRRVQRLAITGTFIGCLLMLCTSLTLIAGAEPTQETANQANRQAIPGDCHVNQKYPESVRQWCDWITFYAEQVELPPDLIAAVIWLESGGNPQAYSKSGAVGLMQVMPRDGLAANFRCINGPCFASRPTIEELQQPEFNIEYGVKMLAALLASTGSLRDALKAYGPMDVGYSYADRILSIYQQWR